MGMAKGLGLDERGLRGGRLPHVLSFVEEEGARKNGDESTNFSGNLCCTLRVPVLFISNTPTMKIISFSIHLFKGIGLVTLNMIILAMMVNVVNVT